ncbi:TonB-dependent receptor [Flavobacteriaceae bacterium]|nr:TonB-dependent receptor [Flavobacteriaceae bacterium]MDA9213312.1 TonB-dependent receptor [Flavobacteriaceae bacterium]MDB4013610.1 TonB-dependent receptor [Flavobacteriaceae bacterium]MDC3301337.1 TonB-dependent receptor [Flavobacteriaceae bacterium]
MKKLLLFFLFISTSLLHSQNNKVIVTGTITDSETNIPLEYATISVFNVGSEKAVNGVITDSNGEFSIELNKGNYDFKVEFISFKIKYYRNITVNDPLDLGTVELSIDENMLEEIEVIGEKTEIEIKLDKTVYNIGKDLTLKGSSVSDVLDNLPSVEVDIEGNVSLRGNESVRILINGKPSGLVGISSNEALKQFPSESVEKVEVITSPSARYNAEGTAGIINIILRRSKLTGFNGSLSLNSGYPERYGVSANLNYRTKKLNFFNNVGYNTRTSEGSFINETEYYTDQAINNFLNENGVRDSERNSNYLNTGIEYFISDKTSLVGSYVLRKSDGFTNNTNNVNQNFNTISKFSERLEKESEIDDTNEFSINLTHDFNKEGHVLTIDYQKEKSSENENGFISNSQLKPVFTKYLSEKVNTDEIQESELFKIDYVLPIKKDGQFELGFRRSNQYQDIDYLAENEDLNGNFINDLNLSNTLIYNEKVNAFYTQYGNKKNKFSFLLGLRYEESKTTVKQLANNTNNVKNYNDFFPTLNLSYQIKENETITFGYNRRIRRARSYFINPFPSKSSATNIFQGNPNIDPTYSNGIDLGYLKRYEKLTLNGSIYYRKETGVFTFISENTGDFVLVNEILVPVLRRTPINLASNKQIGLELNANFTQSKNWRLNGSLNFYESETLGEYMGITYDSKNLTWSGRLSNNLKLFSSVDWQTSFRYRAPQKTAVSERKASIYSNTAFSKDLSKDKITLTFKVNDIFETGKWRIESFNENYKSYSESNWRGGRTLELNLIYRFNQKKKQSRNSGGYNDYNEGGFGT